MVRIYREKDARKSVPKKKKIAILGYGSQGHAHANNLRESGMDVVVGELPGSENAGKAKKAGFPVVDAAAATGKSDVVAMLLPDELQGEIYRRSVGPNLKKGADLMFAHGFNIHYREIVPPGQVDVSMVAPKSPGRLVRSEFAHERGVPSLVAVHQDASGHAQADALAYAWGIGSTRAGVIETSFREETETDLFGEQAVLCGGVTALIKAGFETLVDAGYAPEMAYFECLHELKLIVDLMYEGGIGTMNYSISNNAEYGEYVTGPKVIDERVKNVMREALARIQSGEYAKDFVLENRAGAPTLLSRRRMTAEHPIETVGGKLRDMMPWIRKNRLVDQSKN